MRLYERTSDEIDLAHTYIHTNKHKQRPVFEQEPAFERRRWFGETKLLFPRVTALLHDQRRAMSAGRPVDLGAIFAAQLLPRAETVFELGDDCPRQLELVERVERRLVLANLDAAKLDLVVLLRRRARRARRRSR